MHRAVFDFYVLVYQVDDGAPFGFVQIFGHFRPAQENFRIPVQLLFCQSTRLRNVYLDGEIWELRPIRDRILFAAWDGQSFILLHHFMKKTQKTPATEIRKAKQNLADYRERMKDDEQRSGI